MKVNRLILGIFIVILSVNLVFAATSWCEDRDATEGTGDYPRGVNYYKNSYNNGANDEQGSWTREQDSCSGTKLLEVYCDKTEDGMWVRKVQEFDCGINGCDKVRKICKTSAGQMTGLATLDSPTGYLGVGVIIIVIIVLVWFFLVKKKKTAKKKR